MDLRIPPPLSFGGTGCTDIGILPFAWAWYNPAVARLQAGLLLSYIFNPKKILNNNDKLSLMAKLGLVSASGRRLTYTSLMHHLPPHLQWHLSHLWWLYSTWRCCHCFFSFARVRWLVQTFLFVLKK